MIERIMRQKKTIISVVLVFILGFAILPNFFVKFVVVKGESMHMTLENSEVLLISVFKGKFGNISRGDIVNAKGKGTDTIWIKRVIALPEETVSIKNDVIYINGEPLDEPYLDASYVQAQKEQYGSFMEDMEEIRLGKDEYFLMGDNRRHSLDSRRVGAFSREDILGAAEYVIYPFRRAGALH